jgi:hypothetical protein
MVSLNINLKASEQEIILKSKEDMEEKIAGIEKIINGRQG